MRIRVAILAICAASLINSTVPAAGPPIAFVGVNVVPMDRERVLANHTVVVQDGRISAVGPADKTTVPAGSLRVEGRGKYLMPGLAEMHGHVPPPNSPSQFIEDVLFMYVAHGVTTVRGMRADGPGTPRLVGDTDLVLPDRTAPPARSLDRGSRIPHTRAGSLR